MVVLQESNINFRANNYMYNILMINLNSHKGISDKLVDLAITSFEALEDEYFFEVINIPTLLEVPAAISMASTTEHFQGYIILGAFVREIEEITLYQSYIHSLARLNTVFGTAIGNGVIVADTYEDLVVAASDSQNQAINAVATVKQMIDIQNLFASYLLEEDFDEEQNEQLTYS